MQSSVNGHLGLFFFFVQKPKVIGHMIVHLKQKITNCFPEFLHYINFSLQSIRVWWFAYLQIYISDNLQYLIFYGLLIFVSQMGIIWHFIGVLIFISLGCVIFIFKNHFFLVLRFEANSWWAVLYFLSIIIIVSAVNHVLTVPCSPYLGCVLRNHFNDYIFQAKLYSKP